MTISFLLFLFAFLLIGVVSATQSKKTAEDYLIAGKAVPPWLVGLSAVATNNSGFMFIGMIGLTYTIGLASVWLMFGWIVGDLLISLLTVKKIRQVGKSDRIHSYGGLLSQWQGTRYMMLRRLTGVMTVLFLTVYAAAQLKAGSKATAVLLDWHPATGIVISAFIVLVYSVAGGIRASIWTDAAQSFVMLFGMLLLMIAGIASSGGIAAAITHLREIEPGYLHWFPDGSFFEIALFIAGWLFGGIAVIGQPHIVIRFMSLNSASNVARMRMYYYSWFTLFYGATIVIGLLSRIILQQGAEFDAELALPTMAVQIFPPLLAGLILAAMFAATMSTADSLILACSASVTRDFLQQPTRSLPLTKAVTVIVLTIAAWIAISGNKSIFRLVLDAWGLLGSSFAPLLMIYAFGQRVSETMAIGMVLTGFAAFVCWQWWGPADLIYSVAPGILAGLLYFMIAGLITAIIRPARVLEKG